MNQLPTLPGFLLGHHLMALQNRIPTDATPATFTLNWESSENCSVNIKADPGVVTFIGPPRTQVAGAGTKWPHAQPTLLRAAADAIRKAGLKVTVIPESYQKDKESFDKDKESSERDKEPQTSNFTVPRSLKVVDSEVPTTTPADQAPKPLRTTDSTTTVDSHHVAAPDKDASTGVTSDNPMDTAKEEEAPLTFAQGKAKERIPQVGDRFRVLRDRKPEENFPGHALPSWFFGTATKVIEKKKPPKKLKDWNLYTLHLEFDDGTKNTSGIGYPAPDVQILNVDTDGSAFVEIQNDKRVMAYHRDMKKLAVGDLVDCLYQGGVEDGACFRGRVAAINREEKTCDVSYNDRKYERNVPIDAANLCIVEQGQSAPNWLEGVEIPANFRNTDERSSKGANKHGTGKIVGFDNGQDKDLLLKIKFPGGRVGLMTYSEVVPAVFAQVFKSTDAAKIKLWPATSASTISSMAVGKTTAQPSEVDEHTPKETEDDEHLPRSEQKKPEETAAKSDTEYESLKNPLIEKLKAFDDNCALVATIEAFSLDNPWLFVRCENERGRDVIRHALGSNFVLAELEHKEQELQFPLSDYSLSAVTGGHAGRVGTMFSLNRGNLVVAKARCAYRSSAMNTAGPTLEMMEVAAEWQRHGLGSALLDAMEEYLHNLFREVMSVTHVRFSVGYVAGGGNVTQWFQKRLFQLSKSLSDERSQGPTKRARGDGGAGKGEAETQFRTPFRLPPSEGLYPPMRYRTYPSLGYLPPYTETLAMPAYPQTPCMLPPYGYPEHAQPPDYTGGMPPPYGYPKPAPPPSQHAAFKSIVDHRQIGSEWGVLVSWEDDNKTWEPLLSDPWKKGPYPISNAVKVAQYGKEHGLLETEGWTRFKPFVSLPQNLPRDAPREASLESEEECADQEDYVDEEPGAKSSAARPTMYVKSKIPTRQDILDRRARKNAQSRARAAEKRERAEAIARKPDSERTEEETEFLNKYQTFRQNKNNRSRERAMEMKDEVDRILGKPERKRTRIERDFLERNMDARQRKNLGDRMRRRRIKQEKTAASAAETYGGLYNESYGMASSSVDSSLNGTPIAGRPAGGLESYGMASSSAVTSLKDTPAADGVVESYGMASSSAVVSLNKTPVAAGSVESNGMALSSAEASLNVADAVAESNGTASANTEASLEKTPGADVVEV